MSTCRQKYNAKVDASLLTQPHAPQYGAPDAVPIVLCTDGVQVNTVTTHKFSGMKTSSVRPLSCVRQVLEFCITRVYFRIVLVNADAHVVP